MVMGKHKGNRFELLIYKELREIGSAKRTIGSGSSDEPGDILFTKNNTGYAIECKHYKSVDWKLLNRWWTKIVNETKDFDASFNPVIVYRENRKPIMVMWLGEFNGKKIRVVTSYNLWKQVM